MGDEIWQFAVRKLRGHERIALLVVAESSGSSPGRAGFKMLVTNDEIFGSIGGGVMEVELVERARLQFKMQNEKCEMRVSSDQPGFESSKSQIVFGQSQIDDRKSQIVSGESQIANRKSQMVSGKSQIVPMVHRKNVANSSGMICSGKQTVIMYLLDHNDLAVIGQLAAATEPLGFRISQRGTEIAGAGDSASPRFERNGHEFLYEETIGIRPRLFIVGGGHCALALSELASKLGFAISLFDDREGLNSIEKNSFADEKTIVESYEKLGELIPSDDDAFVVVMTLGFKFDEIVVRALFEKDFRYFGVLGSKAKIKTMFSALEKDGFDRERLNRIHAPVGVKINSRTPEEIAVSIAAELIAVKNAV